MISRDPASATDREYDLAIVGGGIYGIALCLEASRRGLETLLIERDDFGGNTSWNSLRILHGGLRYLQKLDLRRFRESVKERSWWLRTYPELVHPLPCVMPLYGRGLKRTSVLGAALGINHSLSLDRNRGIPKDCRLERGGIISRSHLEEIFPTFDPAGVKSAALWYDALMPRPERIMIEMLHWACRCGATCLNYVEARRLERQGEKLVGIVGWDREQGQELLFRSKNVLNSAGPWAREAAATLDRDFPALFRPSLALNVLLDRPRLGKAAMALDGGGPEKRTFFLCPWRNKTCIGTSHVAWIDDSEWKLHRQRYLEEFLEAVCGLPCGLDVSRSDVIQAYWGMLPARSSGSTALASRPVFIDHGQQAGIRGLFSISGVKFTTARAVGESTLRQLWHSRGHELPEPEEDPRPAVTDVPTWSEFEKLIEARPDQARSWLRRLRDQESILRLSDIMLRRTDWCVDTRASSSRAESVGHLFDWSTTRLESELESLGATSSQPSFPIFPDT